jgi:hypothetical protein
MQSSCSIGTLPSRLISHWIGWALLFGTPRLFWIIPEIFSEHTSLSKSLCSSEPTHFEKAALHDDRGRSVHVHLVLQLMSAITDAFHSFFSVSSFSSCRLIRVDFVLTQLPDHENKSVNNKRFLFNANVIAGAHLNVFAYKCIPLPKSDTSHLCKYLEIQTVEPK